MLHHSNSILLVFNSSATKVRSSCKQKLKIVATDACEPRINHFYHIPGHTFTDLNELAEHVFVMVE